MDSRRQVESVITPSQQDYMGSSCNSSQGQSLPFSQHHRLISRAMVFICITLLYARLYVFLKRPDKIRSPYSNSPTGQSYDSSYKKKATGFLRKFSGEKDSPAEKGEGTGTGNNGGHGEGTGVGVVDFANPNPIAQPDQTPKPSEFNRDNRPVFNSSLLSTKFPESSYRPPSAPVSPMSEIPPWERIELPIFQVDGQRYGGPSASTRTEMFGGWKGMTSKKRPSTANSTGSNPQTPMPMPFPRGSISHHNTRGSDGTETTRSRQPSSETTLVSDRHTDKERTRKTSMMTTASNTSSTNYSHLNSNQGNGLNYVNSRRPSAAPPLASPVMEIDNEDFLRSRSDRGGDEEDRRSREEEEEEEEEEEDEEEESDGEMDLMRMLAQDSEPVDQQRRGSREEYELVPESMASYLNRKTALLMLWFPLGVSLLHPIKYILIHSIPFIHDQRTSLRSVGR